ncbi:M23 family metallopeptidase [Litchfieldia salsa]|uniref:Stage II sporulation protein Q n=1 Tax=Litchfieldia salsa TaxID=930152 RepID=A0A1H0U3L4_9BACI|nr:M23 family metallopeptidase [Litchfieldia salsa]SDP60426.1 stage II sporulation protein Q [Litchfieldia salsa]
MREEETKRTSPKSNGNQFFKKRWVFPAIYLASAAIILTAVLWFQGNNNDNLADSDKFGYDESDVLTSDKGQDSVVVNRPAENFVMPVLNQDVVEIQKQFYDVNGSAEEQEAALVFYDNSYTENKGIDIVAKDGSVFDVTASLNGTVTRSEKDPTLGNVVEIEHAEGVVTVYQALSDVQVKQGDQVQTGQVIAKSGKNLLNKEADSYVHFEIRNNGVAVNPIDFFGKPMTSLEEEAPAQDKEQPAQDKEEPAQDKEEPAAEEGTEEEAPADEEGSGQEEKAPADDENADDATDATNSSDATIGMAKA